MVNKVSWQQVGRVTEPGRYMFTFGWLTVAPEDLAVWHQFPNAAFTLVRTTAAHAGAAAPESIEQVPGEEEFHLGAFDLPAGSPAS
ncbi:MAG: hypothetical protein QOF07_2182 [Bradyrhizobium sp.]|nr:hypothetical protein [Bradyrhizobium sp.]